MFDTKGEYYIATACKEGITITYINKALQLLLLFLLKNNGYQYLLDELMLKDVDVDNLTDIIYGMTERGVLQFVSDSKVNDLQFREIDSDGLERLFIEVTNACNLDCIHCYNSREYQHSYIDVALLKELMEEAHGLGVWLVDITGGEPFMHPQIMDILEVCTEYGMFLNLYTNATLLNGSVIKTLEVKCRIQSLIVSLDGLSCEIHDLIRGVSGSFDTTMENLEVISKSKLPLRVNTMLIKQNQEEVNGIIEFAYDKLGAVSVAVSPILKAGKGEKISDYCVPPNIVYDALLKSHKELKLDTLPQGSDTRHTYCGVYDTTLYISPDFEVFLCPTLTKYENSAFSLGTYHANSLKEISHKLINFENCFQCEEINFCPYAELCKGGCRSRAYLNTGKTYGIDEFMCNYFNHSI